jgi:hypothetical protein
LEKICASLRSARRKTLLEAISTKEKPLKISSWYGIGPDFHGMGWDGIEIWNFSVGWDGMGFSFGGIPWDGMGWDWISNPKFQLCF